MDVVLDVYARDVRKKIIDPDIVTMYLLQKKKKKVDGEIHMLVCTH